MPIQAETSPSSGPAAFPGWRGLVLVAATYVYFLIFAQFGFLKRLGELGFTGDALKPVMAAMAAGGILASLAAARLGARHAPRRLRFALVGCAAAAALTLLPLSRLAFAGVAFLIGISLGALTVTLVANLPLWMGSTRPLMRVGLGTGLGYWICNIPALFAASAWPIALAALAACGAGLLAAARTAPESPQAEPAATQAKPIPFALILAWFTALVWLDSAAFFIIQNSPALKSGTWAGSEHLWRMGTVHFLAAMACVLILEQFGATSALLAAFACLAGACLLLLNPSRIGAASWLYPAGVSLYSVVLVAYPALLIAHATAEQRARRAGWLYAIAGWVGSALGIGMAQHLHRIPAGFVAAAAVLFLLPLAVRYGKGWWRQTAAISLVLIASWAIEHALHVAPAPAAQLTPVERGRRVYISEGCINCHSQYVRPNTADVEMWGPTRNLEAIRREHPPLIGNRRQGPDLSEVGARRSPLWLRIHLIDPRAVSYGSIMPSYAYLFRDQRGNDLVAYLASLRSPGAVQHIRQEAASWRPPASAARQARHIDGARLFAEYCATCHEPGGGVRTRWGAEFPQLPPILDAAAMRKLGKRMPPAELRLSLARIVKFGLPGTNMAGHEYMPDPQVEALVDYLSSMHAPQ